MRLGSFVVLVFRASALFSQCILEVLQRGTTVFFHEPFCSGQHYIINISANMLNAILCFTDTQSILAIPMEIMHRKFQRLHLSIIASAAL